VAKAPRAPQPPPHATPPPHQSTARDTSPPQTETPVSADHANSPQQTIAALQQTNAQQHETIIQLQQTLQDTKKTRDEILATLHLALSLPQQQQQQQQPEGVRLGHQQQQQQQQQPPEDKEDTSMNDNEDNDDGDEENDVEDEDDSMNSGDDDEDDAQDDAQDVDEDDDQDDDNNSIESDTSEQQFWQRRRAQGYCQSSPEPHWSCALRQHFQKELPIPAADDANKTVPSKKSRPSQRQRHLRREERRKIPSVPFDDTPGTSNPIHGVDTRNDDHDVDDNPIESDMGQVLRVLRCIEGGCHDTPRTSNIHGTCMWNHDDARRDDVEFWQHRQAQSYGKYHPEPWWSGARRQRIQEELKQELKEKKSRPPHRQRPSKRQRKRAQEEKERAHDDPDLAYAREVCALAEQERLRRQAASPQLQKRPW
jgi:hypothetical protein